jgi:hypothetical protein
MKFDPEHLRIAAEVRAKARRRSRFELASGLLLLLIMALTMVWAVVALAHMFLLAIRA